MTMPFCWLVDSCTSGTTCKQQPAHHDGMRAWCGTCPAAGHQLHAALSVFLQPTQTQRGALQTGGIPCRQKQSTELLPTSTCFMLLMLKQGAAAWRTAFQ